MSPRTTIPISALSSHLSYWLRFVSNQVSHAFRAKLAARDVTVAEWVVMRELFDHETVVPSELAYSLGMSRGAISKLADRLATKGLVTRSANATDRRYQALALTKEGLRLVPKLALLADQNDVEFFGHLTPVERAAIEETMRGIVQRFGLTPVPLE